MHSGLKWAALTGALAYLTVGSAFAAPAVAAPTECNWGGTAAEPTGIVTASPGFTNSPSAGPLQIRAWGSLQGPGCKGTGIFTGIAQPGASCLTSMFEGSVQGFPGGATYLRGPGFLNAVSENLYDRQGNLVGSDQPIVKAFGAPKPFSSGLDCNTPEGFTRGLFSSTVQIY
jgi:hypothetical protein